MKSLVFPFITFAFLGLILWLLPSESIDPWNLFNPKKMATMVYALAFIQFFGELMRKFLGLKIGAILTGFFGGLISSTATTASIARKSKIEELKDDLNSKVSIKNQNQNDILIFLSATAAMLLEGVVIVSTGTSDLHLSNLYIFMGPLIITIVMIYFYARKKVLNETQIEDNSFKLLPLLKLSAFIISILIVSKLLQNFFGQNGLLVLTFLVSLFEIHGSVIANVQLHETHQIQNSLFIHLMAISIFSSYLSQLFLILTIGSIKLRSQTIKCTMILFISLLLSWSVSS